MTTHLSAISHEQAIEEVVADKGYYSANAQDLCQHLNFRTYIPEPKRTSGWDWSERTEEHQRAVMNKRRVGGFRNRENFKTDIFFYCGGLSLYPQ